MATAPSFSFSEGGTNFTLLARDMAFTDRFVSAYFIMRNDSRLYPTETGQVVLTCVVDTTLLGAHLNGTMKFSYVSPNTSTTACAYWTAQKSWDRSGVTTIVEDGIVRCETVHLTNFAVLAVRLKMYLMAPIASCFSE